MATDKIRKYVLPNIPYLFIGWFCLKIGTAYRLAAGAGFGEKLLGLGQTIGAAFADFVPGLVPFDWLVGVVGALAFRLLIYCKAKKAKKFRRDAEYGTARWGTAADIKPFFDPKFENNMLLTATERLTMNTRPKIPPMPATSISAASARPAPEKPAFGSRPSFCRLIRPMWWSIPRAVCWGRSEPFSSAGAIRSKCSTA